MIGQFIVSLTVCCLFHTGINFNEQSYDPLIAAAGWLGLAFCIYKRLKE